MEGETTHEGSDEGTPADSSRARRRLELLAKVSTLVGNLDPEELLPRIAELSIPELADWSAVDLLDDKSARRIYVAHHNPDDAPVAARLQQFKPFSSPERRAELRAGRTIVLAHITDENLRANVEGREHYELVRPLGFCSCIAVPLRIRDETVAVMTFTTIEESGRHYTSEDVTLAEELARRASALIERVRLQAELKASNERLRIALAMARTSVYEQDRELRYTQIYTTPLVRDLIGKSHDALFPPDLAAQITELKRRVLQTGEPYRGEKRVTVGEKTTVMRSAIDPLRDDSGAIVGILGASTDITDEMRVRDELAQAVTFREQLMGILGHDLRNPLGAILAAAMAMRRRPNLPAPARDQLDRIDRATRRMAEMIGTVLDFTRARFHDALPVTPAPTDLAEIALAIVDELRAAEPNRAIELATRGDAHGCWDPARLGQLVSNLVGNSLVHGRASEPVRVTIDAGGDEVLLHVHNDGEAIAPELMPVLFEPFRRGETQASRAAGLGLGLYIVREIVRAHDGDIAVESTPAAGTTFSVRLPRAIGAARTPRDSPRPSPSPDRSIRPG